MKRIGITGSRSIVDMLYIYDVIDQLFIKYVDIIIIVGDASGVDTIVYNYCIDCGICCIRLKPAHKYFPSLYKGPQDNKLYYARNMNVVDNSDIVVAIWDGKSGGTKQTIDYAKKQGVELILR